MSSLDSVEIWPKGLLFYGKFNKIYKRKFVIYNPSNSEVAFKVDDTLPDNFVIEPDHGYIRSKNIAKITMRVLPFADNFSESQEVTVLLCNAPANKQVNVWSGGDFRPEQSHVIQLKTKFLEIEENEDSSVGTTSENSSDESSVESKPNMGDGYHESECVSGIGTESSPMINNEDACKGDLMDDI